jgi:nitrite reductase/ring-hydroxylating ferredoxin subunit
MYSKIKRVQTTVLLLLIALLYGCNGFESSIPDRDVYIERIISLSGILRNPGGYLYIDSQPVDKIEKIGFGGILIMHTLDDNYYAVDLACPHEINALVKIEPPNELGICTCKTCGEKFYMSDGSGMPQNGISKQALRHYNVSFSGTDRIIITR